MKSYIFFLQIGLILLFSLSVRAEPPPKKLWVSRYDVSAGSRATAIALDGSGNVYVTGGLSSDYYVYDYATIKYDSDGNELWVRRYNGPGTGNDDFACAIAVDDSGNVYVTGSSGTEVPEDNYGDYATIKYDSDGNELWVRTHNGTGVGDNNFPIDWACAIAVDGSGNIYVTGTCFNDSTGDDYTTIKYDSDGNELWVRNYDGPYGSDEAHAMAVDSGGNVYVTGNSGGGHDTYFDYATVKYDTNGNEIWVRRYDGPGDDSHWWGWGDAPWAIALDSSGNVYVTGQSFGGYDIYDDYATIKYDTNGNELWVRRYNGPGDSFDRAEAIAVDGSGNVYVTGSITVGIDDSDSATIKYDSDGNELWVRRYSYGGACAIAVDSSGNVYVAGFSGTIKYDPNGNQKWLANDCAATLAIDNSGNVYVTGCYVAGYETIKYAQCLSPIDCDLNEDCKVNFTDFAVLASAWTTEEGQAGWDPNCDIALPSDGKIDLKDLAIIAEDWLECNWSAPEVCW